MFTFSLTEEQELIAKSAHEFAQEQLLPHCREMEKKHVVSEALHAQYDALGFSGAEIPSHIGGLDLSPLDRMLLLHNLAQGDVAVTLAFDGLGPAIYPLLESQDNQEQCYKILSSKQGRGWVVFDDEERFTIKDGKITGVFPWVPANELAVFIVIQGQTMTVIDQGMAMEKVIPQALHAAGSSEITLDAPIVFSETLTQKAYAKIVARLRLYVASLMTGVATVSLKYAMDYTQNRIAFGLPIAHHQGVAFLFSELAVNLDAAKMSCWRLAWALTQDGDPTEAGAAAMIHASNSGVAIGEQSVQMLGGHGYMKDFPVEKWMREIKTLAQLWGGSMAAIDDSSKQLQALTGHVGFALPMFADVS